MEMAPRDALVPLLKLAGTAVVAAAVYRYSSKHVVAAAHRHHRKRDGADNAKRKQRASDAQETTDTALAAASAASVVAESAAEHIAPEIKRSSFIIAMLLQDGYLMLAALGVFVMVLAVLLSLAIVALDDNVVSVEELRMFAPLTCVGMGLVSVGLLGSMLRGPSKKRSAAPAIQRCPFSGAVASTPLPPRKKLADGEVEADEDEDEDAAPRVSRCPFGFG